MTTYQTVAHFTPEMPAMPAIPWGEVSIKISILVVYSLDTKNRTESFTKAESLAK